MGPEKGTGRVGIPLPQRQADGAGVLQSAEAKAWRPSNNVPVPLGGGLQEGGREIV